MLMCRKHGTNKLCHAFVCRECSLFHKILHGAKFQTVGLHKHDVSLRLLAGRHVQLKRRGTFTVRWLHPRSTHARKPNEKAGDESIARPVLRNHTNTHPTIHPFVQSTSPCCPLPCNDNVLDVAQPRASRHIIHYQFLRQARHNRQTSFDSWKKLQAI